MQTMTPQSVTVPRTCRPVGRTPDYTLPLGGGGRHADQAERETTPDPALTSLLPSFVRCRRAAATALAAAVMTLMSVGGIAMVSDHAHLVYQRDTLTAAADAATIATTRHLVTLSPSLTDADMNAALKSMAERYILVNMPESLREDVAESLVLNLTANRSAGTVNIVAQADLGGIIFGNWLYGNPVEAIQVASGTERLESITEVALAIDVTHSMNSLLSDRRSRIENALLSDGRSRIEAVKTAAQDLVATLTQDGTAAIGLVPWDYRVRLDLTTRTRWEDRGWAHYPAQRYYPLPTLLAHPGNRAWYPDPYGVGSSGETHPLPSKPEVWQGCVDQRNTSGPNPPGLSVALPTTEDPLRFPMKMYSPVYHNMTTQTNTSAISFECYDQHQNHCYDDSSHANHQLPQFSCPETLPTISPLTTDSSEILEQIENLQPTSDSYGGYWPATYSALGVVWGHRLLAPTWRTIWGENAVHPMDPATLDQTQYPEGMQKVLVLLTDGDDSHLPANVHENHLGTACTAAKNAGIKVFVVAAMRANETLEDRLEQCSSQADDPTGTYVFVNNSTTEALRSAFQQIAQQFVRFRRVS